METELDKITEGYIVVPVSGVDLAQYSDRKDLQIFDEEFDTGVKALFAGDDDSIVAFLFNPGRFDEKKAKEWVTAAEADGVNMTLNSVVKASRDFFSKLFGPMIRLGQGIRKGGVAGERSVKTSLDNESFNQIEQRLWDAVFKYYECFENPNSPYPFLVEAHKDFCIVECEKEFFKHSYSFGENDEIILGDPQKVRPTYVPASLQTKIVDDHRINRAFSGFPLEDHQWDWTTEKENAILDKGGWSLFARAHLVVELENGELPKSKDKYHFPVAELLDGRLHYVWAGVRAARGALAGARGGVKLSQGVKDACMETVEELYKKFGKEDLLKSQMAVIFSMALSDEEPPSEVADGKNDLIWKEIVAVSKTFRPLTGDELEIDQEFIDELFDSFEAEVLENIAITAGDHCEESDGIVPADKTVGFVRKLKKVGGRLWAGLEILKDDIKEALGQTIKDVSIFAWSDFHDRRDGKKWPWVLVHLLLTNYPQLVGLSPFGEEPVGASAGEPRLTGKRDYFYLREVVMPNQTNQVESMAGVDVQELAAFRSLGLSVAEIQAIQAERVATRRKARDLEISTIIAALEGRGTHDGVVVCDGAARHYPVVVHAVEQALRADGGEAMSLDISSEGQSPIDEIVLSIVNAIPLEGRMVETQLPVTQPQETPSPPTSSSVPTDEQIADLDERI